METQLVRDIRMIPTDRKLRHLARLMDSEKMRDVFEKTLYADGSNTIQQCQIIRIKYKPAKNCQVCYRLVVEDKVMRERTEQLLYARCFETGGAKSRYRKARRGMPDKDPTSNAVLYIAELDTVVWVFPNDRKLKRLAEITDSRLLKQTDLPKQILTGFGPDWAVDSSRPEIIRYVPEHTCTIRASLCIENHLSKSRRDIVLYGKVYYNNDGERTYSLMRRLWDSPARRLGKLRIPQPMNYQKSYKLLWVKSVPGLMLADLTGDPKSFLENISDAAKQIACLHQQPIIGCAETDAIDPCRELERVKLSLRMLDGPNRQKANQVIEHLYTLMPVNESRPCALLHGDLHLKNILCDSGGIYLIDLDNLVRGDPLQEVGSFVSTILDLGLTGRIPSESVDRTIEYFLESYRENVPWLVSNTHLRWHISAALIYQRLYRGYTRLKPGRLKILGQLVDLAEGLLAPEFNPDWLAHSDEMVCSNAG